MLPQADRKQIYADTRAVMYHKVGTTVLLGTDNAVLTRMVSLAATGLYSNYSMIILYTQTLISQLLGNFTPSVGNARQKMTETEYYTLFRKITFMGLWISCVVSVCFYTALDDLIAVWLGSKYILGGAVTLALCVSFHLTIARTTNSAFINADGLFVKDRIRPLIEAGLNLGISIALTKLYGIVGVFLGTILSSLLTIVWREPLLLYRYSFKRNVMEYWTIYGGFTLIAVLTGAGIWFLKTRIRFSPTWGTLILESAAAFLVVNGILYLLFRKRDEFQYMIQLIKRLINRRTAK